MMMMLTGYVNDLRQNYLFWVMFCFVGISFVRTCVRAFVRSFVHICERRKENTNGKINNIVSLCAFQHNTKPLDAFAMSEWDSKTRALLEVHKLTDRMRWLFSRTTSNTIHLSVLWLCVAAATATGITDVLNCVPRLAGGFQ